MRKTLVIIILQPRGCYEDILQIEQRKDKTPEYDYHYNPLN